MTTNSPSRIALALATLSLLATPAGADWRTFFHREPPPFVKAPSPKQLAVVSSLPGVPSDQQVESFLRTLADAVMARDGAMIVPRLSQRYAIDDLPDDMKASEFMVQAIGKMPGPTQMVIKSVEVNGAVRIAKVEFRYIPERSSQKTLRFDADGKLLASDLFTLKRG